MKKSRLMELAGLNEVKYRIYMNSDADAPDEVDYEEYFGEGDKAAMIKKAQELAKDGKNQYGDPIKIAVTAEDDINDVAWTNETGLSEVSGTSWIKDSQVRSKVDMVIKTLKNLYGPDETVDGETLQFIIEELGMDYQMLKQLSNQSHLTTRV